MYLNCIKRHITFLFNNLTATQNDTPSFFKVNKIYILFEKCQNNEAKILREFSFAFLNFRTLYMH